MCDYPWLAAAEPVPRVLNKLRALRGPAESYSDVILRLVEAEAPPETEKGPR
jgi:hypothetical protein